MGKMLSKFGSVLRDLQTTKCKKIKADNRPEAAFDLVFFSDAKGIKLLNASLFSVYKKWKYLPKITIISDGTPIGDIKSKLTYWPKEVNIINWQECAAYYNNKNNKALYNYACKDVWGKKFVSVLYCAEQGNILYSDTDVLWFKDPTPILNGATMPYMKMCPDIDFYYTEPMIKQLSEQKVYSKLPMNAGLIHATGAFSVYENWEPLCNYLETKSDNRSEQTAFAILANAYGGVWSLKDIMLTIDDISEVLPKRNKYKDIFARHYVNTKSWLFWRDYLLYF